LRNEIVNCRVPCQNNLQTAVDNSWHLHSMQTQARWIRSLVHRDHGGHAGLGREEERELCEATGAVHYVRPG